MTRPDQITQVTGVGVGFRAPHFRTIMAETPAVPWFEILIDNYMSEGLAVEQLRDLCGHYPIAFHGVGLSLGGSEPLDQPYLRRLAALKREFRPAWLSDHLCWTNSGRHHLHDLLPLPMTRSVVSHVADRIKAVQDVLGDAILVENVSSYLTVAASTMPEWEFLAAVGEAADCGLLVDINNIYVSAHNHRFSADDYLNGLPPARVRELHLAGYDDRGRFLHDTHGTSVSEGVWDLYREALARYGPVPTLIEWDNNLPDLATLLFEAAKAQAIWEERRPSWT